jgi:hypothetical protein
LILLILSISLEIKNKIFASLEKQDITYYEIIKNNIDEECKGYLSYDYGKDEHGYVRYFNVDKNNIDNAFNMTYNYYFIFEKKNEDLIKNVRIYFKAGGIEKKCYINILDNTLGKSEKISDDDRIIIKKTIGAQIFGTKRNLFEVSRGSVMFGYNYPNSKEDNNEIKIRGYIYII